MIDEPLSWTQIKGVFQGTAPLVKQAFERLGSKPAETEFTRTDVGDLRGKPVWEMDHWGNQS